MKTFSERLKYAMTQANLTQRQLAQATGASPAAVSQYLSGKNTPNADRVKSLADATGVSFDFLMGYDVPPAQANPAPNMGRITTKDAARCLGKSDQFVRIGLQRGLLPFGTAVPGTGSKWNYYIDPARFRAYVGAERFNEFFRLTA